MEPARSNPYTGRPIRVVIWGLGAMGSKMGRLLLEKPGFALVGAFDRDPSKVGRQVAEAVGLQPDASASRVAVEGEFRVVDADVAILATGSFLSDVAPLIRRALDAGMNVITIAEEMADPWAVGKELADALDRTAREKGLRILGTGINPGFILDSLIVMLTGVCSRIRSIRAERVNDLAPYGPTVLRTQGVGTTPDEFQRGVKNGNIVGHIGFPQSLRLIAHTLGWNIDRVEEERRPIVTNVPRRTAYMEVLPGQVAGCHHVARCYVGDQLVITLEHPQQITPEAEGVQTGDRIQIDGVPPIDLQIRPEIAGGEATAAIAVNMIPRALEGPPGLLRMIDLPMPAAILGPQAIWRHGGVLAGV